MQNSSSKPNYLLSLIFKAYNRKQEVLIIKRKKNNRAILQKFIEDGFIINYKFADDALIIFLKNNSVVADLNKKIFNLLLKKRFGRKGTLSLKTLVKEQRKGNIPSYYLMTDKGLLLSNETINNTIGGKFIAKII